MKNLKTWCGIALLATFYSGLQDVSGQDVEGSLIPEVTIPKVTGSIPEVTGSLFPSSLIPEVEGSLIPMIHIDDSTSLDASLSLSSKTEFHPTGHEVLTSDLPTPVTVPDPLSVHYSEVAPAEEQVVTEVVMTEAANCECQRSMCHCGRVRYDLLHPPKTMMPPLLSMDATSTYYYFRPYNWRQVLENQADAARWGASPGNPYSNQVFQEIYNSIEFDEL